MAREWLLEVRGLCKSFGRQDALRGVDLQVRRGESLVIFGPNGAGKTTLLRVLAMLSRPSAGTIHFLGSDLYARGAEARRYIGLVTHRTLLHHDLTVEENLLFYGRMYGLPNLGARVEEALGRVAMLDYRQALVRALSRGMQQRLAVARAFLHEPILFLLDEPYTGLDAQAVAILGTLLKEWTTQGKTVIYTSHDLERGARGCDRLMILRAGRVVYEASCEAAAREGWQIQALYDRYATGVSL